MDSFLVFQAAPGPGIYQEDNYSTGQRYRNTPPPVYGQAFGVNAKDPQAAVMAVAAHTRTIGAYAVVPATFIDLAAGIGNGGEDAPKLINPNTPNQ